MNDEEKEIMCEIFYNVTNYKKQMTDELEDYLYKVDIKQFDVQVMCASIYFLDGYEALKRVLKRCILAYTLNNIFSSLKSDYIMYKHNTTLSKYEEIYKLIKTKITNKRR